jgi:exodeoxyribonuclease VII large subunit
MEVVIKGKVSVYPKDGAYQLYCEEMKLEGIGTLSAAFEKMKAKLNKEGLFDVKHKKQIPEYPNNIGVITSPTGAAIKDIINVTRRRNKGINIVIYPALVQGINSASSVIEGINYFNKAKNVDVILIARGGGSIEELWSFNDEALAYAIFNSKIPTVSAVGHETDFTISDFVSDLRAPTPSAGAELLSFSTVMEKDKLKNINKQLNRGLFNYIKGEKDNLMHLKKIVLLNSPMAYIANAYSELDGLKKELKGYTLRKIQMEKETLVRLSSLLNAHNPLNVLNKGYSIIEGDEGVIYKLEKLKAKEEVKITLKDGSGRFKIKYEK